MKTVAIVVLLAGAVALAIGCAEPSVTYVPIYPAPTVHEAQPVYTYPEQANYGTTPNPMPDAEAPAPALNLAPSPLQTNPPPAVAQPAVPP